VFFELHDVGFEGFLRVPRKGTALHFVEAGRGVEDLDRDLALLADDAKHAAARLRLDFREGTLRMRKNEREGNADIRRHVLKVDGPEELLRILVATIAFRAEINDFDHPLDVGKVRLGRARQRDRRERKLNGGRDASEEVLSHPLRLSAMPRMTHRSKKRQSRQEAR